MILLKGTLSLGVKLSECCRDINFVLPDTKADLLQVTLECAMANLLTYRTGTIYLFDDLKEVCEANVREYQSFAMFEYFEYLLKELCRELDVALTTYLGNTYDRQWVFIHSFDEQLIPYFIITGDKDA